ncbi:dihydrodipicolinate synthase family protein [Luteolibacter algae]|uniref:Dihydrodipicolinate synthase family protein n=1 Tax=Luteolibacter algae TaxID=454151 RepID=A0ABW5D939_9BACT
MSLSLRHESKRLHRKTTGYAACLLPFESDGSIAQKSFREAIVRTTDAGLGCAVNMDTGYANLIGPEERKLVLELTQATIGGRRDFVAGAFVEGLEGDLVGLYRGQMDEIVSHGGTPILFQTTRFHNWEPARIVDLYAEVCEGYDAVFGFELGSMFAPNGMIFDEETIRGLISIPSLKGIKHSSLDRAIELRRLQIRDEIRPEFKIFTGNDLAIDMTEYGSDYLLGLAAFCPELFALRDKYWEDGDERYASLTDALQYLGNVAFRAPVPAYKHSCAVFQHLIGRCPSPLTHPASASRPDWEKEILADCAARLGYAS